MSALLLSAVLWTAREARPSDETILGQVQQLFHELEIASPKPRPVVEHASSNRWLVKFLLPNSRWEVWGNGAPLRVTSIKDIVYAPTPRTVRPRLSRAQAQANMNALAATLFKGHTWTRVRSGERADDGWDPCVWATYRMTSGGYPFLYPACGAQLLLSKTEGELREVAFNIDAPLVDPTPIRITADQALKIARAHFKSVGVAWGYSCIGWCQRSPGAKARLCHRIRRASLATAGRQSRHRLPVWSYDYVDVETGALMQGRDGPYDSITLHGGVLPLFGMD